jgi:Rps23 Pro-64 3,4-dihydroxylase Tpa1-like proline 4-hydroxylase
MAVLDNRAYAAKRTLAEAFHNAEPFRHVVIPDFFAREFCERLLADFPSFEDQYALNETGEVGRKAVRTKVSELSPAYQELDDFIQTEEFLELISDITGIPDLLYDPEYFGGGTHENLEGQGLDPHVDFNYHPQTGWHRRLNLIVYLNPEWDLKWGGNFDLHSNPWDPEANEVKSVQPLFNQGVIFETTERSWHGFAPIQLPESHKHASRKSFAIYLYTEDRPHEETAPAHATVYVPDALPEDVKPGQVLSEKQHAIIVRQFAHHRGLLEFLYEREQEFAIQVDTLRRALTEARVARRIGQVVPRVVPVGSHVIVVSKGDPDLVDLPDREAWHFPRAADGGYAGHYPADGAEAIAQLEELRAIGGGYLLLPASSFWWLDHYAELAAHLTEHYKRVWSDETCMIFRLSADSNGQSS